MNSEEFYMRLKPVLMTLIEQLTQDIMYSCGGISIPVVHVVVGSEGEGT